jgi:hypothetical protein
VIGLDRSLVAEDYPTAEGLHFLWSDQQGWPVLDVVRVDVTDGIITWWRGTGGTNRRSEIPGLFGFEWDKYLGSSRISPEAVAHYEMVWRRTAAEAVAHYETMWRRTAAAVKAMLDGVPHDPEDENHAYAIDSARKIGDP